MSDWIRRHGVSCLGPALLVLALGGAAETAGATPLPRHGEPTGSDRADSSSRGANRAGEDAEPGAGSTGARGPEQGEPGPRSAEPEEKPKPDASKEESRAPSTDPPAPPTEPRDNGRKPGHGSPPPLQAAEPGEVGARPPLPRTTPPALNRPNAAASGVPATEDGSPVFEDRAAATGLRFQHFNGMSGQLHIAEVMGSGAALLDYDGDGDLDAFLVQGDRFSPDERYQNATPPPAEGHPPGVDRLFRNLLAESGELRFEDVTAEAGLAPAAGAPPRPPRHGMGVAVGDADGDGLPDLYVTALGSNRLWLNRGDGTFEDATAPSRSDDPRWSTAATFADVDLDGDLDLFVGNYVQWSPSHPESCHAPAGHHDYCGPLNYRPVADRLLENRGDGTFVNLSTTCGLRFSTGAALGALATDLAGGPRPEIYVGNDASANQLWSLEEDGTCRDRALELGVALNAAGRPEGSMGIDAGDADGDGDLDLFLTHVHRETNTLYEHLGDGGFADATARAGLAAPSRGLTAFGTGFLDYDNDGLLDLFAANGTVTVIPALAEAGDPYPLHQPDQLFRNLGPEDAAEGGGPDSPTAPLRFADVSATAGPHFARSEVSRGVALGDVDDDGDTDVLLTVSSGPARLLVNRVGQRNRWIGFDLRRAEGGWTDPAARVTVELDDGRRLLRRVRVDGSYLSAHDPRVLVGLGPPESAPGVTAAVVRWGDGTVERFPLDPALHDRYVTLVRGTAPKAEDEGAPVGGASEAEAGAKTEPAPAATPGSDAEPTPAPPPEPPPGSAGG